MLTRLALTAATVALLVTGGPLATVVLAQTAVPSGEGSSGELVLTKPVPPSDELPILEIPPPLPPIGALLSAAPEPPPPAPVISAPAVDPPFVASLPPATTPSSAASPAALPRSRQIRRRPVVKAVKTPTAGPTLTVVNGRESPVVSVTVTVGDIMMRQTRLVVPNARVSLALPKTTGCTVIVEAIFQDEGVSEIRSIDACKFKVVRLTG